MKVKKKKAILLKSIPVSVHSLFKAYCARRGKNMSERIREFMRECADKEMQLRSIDAKGE